MGHPTPFAGPAFRADAPFAALRRAKSPRAARWSGRLVLLGFLFVPALLLVVPWQQTVTGRGQVVAYSPTERKQVLTSRINGLIGKWYVVEGSVVKAGDPIVDIVDNDAELQGRLDLQRRYLESRKAAAADESAQQDRVVKAQEEAQKAAVAAAKVNRDAAALQVAVAEQAKDNAAFALKFEKLRYEMQDRLFSDPKTGGLTAGITRDEAKMRSDRADTDVKRADVEVKRAAAGVKTNEALILQAEAAGLSAVAAARRDHNRAEQNYWSAERELQELDTRIERFKARFVKAPVAGTVFRISANVAEGGQYVKEGDELAVVVPDTSDRVVELFLDGVDAPLVAAHMENTGEGPHVRVQFEGWPAVQFAGWPSVAVGTFGGRVRQMDPHDDGYGRFRVLIGPDPAFEDDVWPEGLYLRQGNQAIGWVFLNRVTLGFELWRNFNGFPPVVAPKAPEKDKGGKPPKIKPPG
jgi:adhesin transport system membrane fusion protein